MIKNIIFDQGGVILNIDYTLVAKEFLKLGAVELNELYTQHEQILLFDLYETGKISSEEFREALKKALKIPHISDEEFDYAWNAMLLDAPIERLNYIEQLKQKYRIFLLSNANEIHMIKANQIYKQLTGHPSLDYYFHKTYFSHLCGFRKPKPEAFELVLRENDLLAQETLFIDDSYQHIEGAEKLDIKTLYLPEKTILEVLPELLMQHFG